MWNSRNRCVWNVKLHSMLSLARMTVVVDPNHPLELR
jgi:hypothetical protein